MSVITLTTDWQNDDYYISAVKGRILQSNPQAKIIDISHRIQTFSVAQAAFVIKASYKHFPEGSVHIIGVNSEASNNQPYVIVKLDGHYFICADNGIFGLLADEEPEQVVVLEEKTISSFPEAFVFADVAAQISAGKKAESLGEVNNNLNRQINMLPVFDGKSITGNVLYIDSYQNIITNIQKSFFERVAKNRRFEIFIQSNRNKIDKINSRYNESEAGELLALFNSIGLLEVAINKGRVSELFSLEINSTVRIKFYEEGEAPEDEYLKNFK